MSDKKLKWGILGSARVCERLLPAIIEAPNSQLVAIASRRAGAAKATLEKHAPQLTDTLPGALGWVPLWRNKFSEETVAKYQL